MLSVALLLALLTAAAQPPSPAPLVFVVRHAERADAGTSGASMMKADPELSARGQARAKSLAGMLRDAGIRAIYTSERKRTQQTAAPLASSTGAKLNIVPADDVTALVGRIRSERGNVLVVGHSNTVPEILAALGDAESVQIGDNDFDNLFIVIPGTPVRVVRLRYE